MFESTRIWVNMERVNKQQEVYEMCFDTHFECQRVSFWFLQFKAIKRVICIVLREMTKVKKIFMIMIFLIMWVQLGPA